MYIRRTTIKSRHTGEPYYTYRLVDSVRTPQGVRQRTLVNLGRHFDVPREQWPALAQRIEQIVSGQGNLLAVGLDAQLEARAQHYGAMLVAARAQHDDGHSPQVGDYHTVDANAVDVVRPRSVAVEHVALCTLRQVGLDNKLKALGLTGPQQAAAIGALIARMAAPGSEHSTHAWLHTRSGLGELIDYDFTTMSLMQLYRVSDQLLAHKQALEDFLYRRERSLFEFDEVLTLYDLTNTYFEGTGRGNSNAAFGRSKEKRSDCPLVTLALVLDGSGFPKNSAVFSGNVSEPKTLAEMVGQLMPKDRGRAPTVVLDAGIATEENVAWLAGNDYRYLVVSRKRHRQFNAEEAQVVKDQGEHLVQVNRVVNSDTGEVELYCHSSQREKTEQGIEDLYAKRFETELEKLAGGLHKRGTVKRYTKVLERVGRLKQRYSRASKCYEVSVEHDMTSANATAVHWKRNKTHNDTLPGLYCLRTNQNQWDETTLWRTFTMLTDLEAVLRSLKSELGLRPVFHHKTDRVSGHLFLSVIAYHLVHTIRFPLKAQRIHLSWEGLRRQLTGQDRVTVELKRADGKTLHIRRATRPEPRQKVIYNALGISERPGRTEKTVISGPLPAQKTM